MQERIEAVIKDIQHRAEKAEKQFLESMHSTASTQKDLDNIAHRKMDMMINRLKNSEVIF